MEYDPADLEALEPDQFSAARHEPLPRRELGRGVLALLVILRIYVFIAIPLVAYAFVSALMAGAS
jgi:hypothetical protein